MYSKDRRTNYSSRVYRILKRYGVIIFHNSLSHHIRRDVVTNYI